MKSIQMNQGEKLLKRFMKILSRDDSMDLEEFASLDWSWQKGIIEHYCNKHPHVFVELFFEHHLKTKNLPTFHIDWLESVLLYGKDKLLVVAPREHAKSTYFSLFIPLFQICFYVKDFIVIASDSSGQSEMSLGSIRRELEENEYIRLIFGDLVASQRKKDEKIKMKRWNTKELLTTNGVRLLAVSNMQSIRGIKDKDKRPDMIIVDDIENESDAESDTKIEKSRNWFFRTLMNLGTVGTQKIMVGTYVSDNGLIGHILNHPENFGWYVKFYKIYQENGDILWSDWWTKERIAKKIQEIGEDDFEKEYMMNPEAGRSEIFNIGSIDRAKERGCDLRLVPNKDYCGDFKFFVAGVDLAIKQKKHADDFSMLTLGVRENGERVVVNVRVGHFSPAEQRRVLFSEYQKFDHQLILIENNSYQDYFVQEMNELSSLPIKGYNTGTEKFDEELGINSLAVLLENDKLTLPYDDEDVNTLEIIDRLVKGMKRYPKGHSDDILMSLWFAEMAARRTEKVFDFPKVKVTCNLYDYLKDEEY